MDLASRLCCLHHSMHRSLSAVKLKFLFSSAAAIFTQGIKGIKMHVASLHWPFFTL